MNSSQPVAPATTDVDVLIVGAGIVGIYQLHLARERGFSVALLEAGDGVGGTWYWNRYPEARFDSESYTYAYIFSEELFDEWEWQEHFAGQPEIERYLNHVVDRFDLRRHITFGARVTSAVLDEATLTWQVRTADGAQVRARVLVAATGVLSVPFFPDVPGRETFRGVSHHTGLWPAEGVEVAGKRVAVVGTGSSGVQVIPAIAGDVASLTVYQRTPNWCSPLQNAPITAEEQVELRANFEQMCEILNTSISGFLHEPLDRSVFDDPPEVRRARFEQAWATPGFGTLICNYRDVMTDPAASALWGEFAAEKIRELVHDPATAELLIPTDHHFGEKRPPFVTGYYETYNLPHVELVDLRSTPIVRVTEWGIETADGHRELDVIVWATGFDFGTGALNRMGIRGRRGRALEDDWADGPTTFLGVMSHGYPNLFYPGGPHGAAGNNPRYAGDQVDFLTDLLVRARDEGYDGVEVTAEAEAAWTAMVDRYARLASFSDKSYFFGSNVPGKPRRYLLNPAGRPKLLEMMASSIADGHRGFHFLRADVTSQAREPAAG